ncbi:Rap1a/Tai family immunity protein [Sphingopyxis sp. GC21]|uniref:Rap1a/Tai family immunity protein n=1 Tax=Sphingopyxis sp. GC21 TaxID=2933562 RepID=UPI0021E3CDD4|nr:Rap1a/Tai family immunity protein [Sphingopyxis sp. GC21]
MTALKGIVLASVALASFPGHADAGIFRTGNDLWATCNTPQSNPDFYQKYYQCSGYIIGAVDSLELSSAIEGRGECIPATANVGQITDIVIAYLRDKPAKRSLMAPNVIALAMNEAFSCRMLPAPALK